MLNILRLYLFLSLLLLLLLNLTGSIIILYNRLQGCTNYVKQNFRQKYAYS